MLHQIANNSKHSFASFTYFSYQNPGQLLTLRQLNLFILRKRFQYLIDSVIIIMLQQILVEHGAKHHQPIVVLFVERVLEDEIDVLVDIVFIYGGVDLIEMLLVFDWSLFSEGLAVFFKDFL